MTVEIDLSVASPGDEFLTRHGHMLEYLMRNARNKALPHILVTEAGIVESYTDAGCFRADSSHSGMDITCRKAK